MKDRRLIGFTLLFLLSLTAFLSQTKNVSATSWVKFDPSEVVGRAKLVVRDTR
jgi:hypothetical protein